MVSTAEAIAIAEICVYIPVFILTIIVVVRHGFQKQLGWIYLAIFCVIRLVGAGFRIESVHNPTNKTDIEWSAILQSVGLSPLLMASLGLLKRM
jgi:prolipoprotein diacylglyceryltransferase